MIAVDDRRPTATCITANAHALARYAGLCQQAGIVPPAVPGIAFLSGGQGPDLATAHLQVMAERGPHPWQLTFSYGRALQDDALTTWAGQESHFSDGRDALLRRVRANAAAREGRWSPEREPVGRPG